MASLNSTFVELEIPDTRSLLELAQAGDAEAYGQVYRAYACRLLRQAFALCANMALAEELAQDTLVEAWKCLPRYNARCDFFTWLCAILLNRYRNNVRKNRLLNFSILRTKEKDEFKDAVEKLTDNNFLPDEAAESNEEAALVWNCIAHLSAKHQQVIFLRFFVGDSLEGIAAALGCSVGTVKSRLFHALDKLRGMNAIKAHFVNFKMKR